MGQRLRPRRRHRHHRRPGRLHPGAGEALTADVRTLARGVSVEVEKVKGSRFVGDAAPIDGEPAAMAVLEAVRDRDPDASHHCWAFVLADGRSRCADDGEPGGTAGAPILRRITGAGLADVVVVVTRWFGGTKLGTGGLVRAYGGCAAAVLDAGDVVVRPAVARFALRHPYELSNAVAAVLAAFSADVVASTFTDDVALEVAVPAARAAAFPDAVVEATAGQVVATPAPRR